MTYIGTSAAQANLLTTFIKFYCPNSLNFLCLTNVFLQKKNNYCFLSLNFDLKLYFCISGKSSKHIS